MQKAKPGATLKATLVATNPLPRKQKLTVTLEGRGLTADQTWEVEVPAGATLRRDVTVKLGEKVEAGRSVFALRVAESDKVDGSDAFMAVDVER